MGEFCLHIGVVKAILRQHARLPHVLLPTSHRIVATKKYCLQDGYKEIGEATEELPMVNIISPAHSPYKSPVWPVQKPDETWHMTVDYR